MSSQPKHVDARTPEQLREHYEIETELAQRLRSASREQRRGLYSLVYDELYRRVPSLPQNTRKLSPERTARAVSSQMDFLRPYLKPDITFLELGPGDCSLSIEVAKSVKRAYAVDVSAEIAGVSSEKGQLQLVLSDGCSVPVPEGTVDVAYSTQMMEHLHPDDAFEQLGNVFRALAPRGVYLCATPNRLNGPHDVSGCFDEPIATGLHLKEYTTRELTLLFRRVGFSKVRAMFAVRDKHFTVPVFPIALCEGLLEALGHRYGKALARKRTVRRFLGIRLVGQK